MTITNSIPPAPCSALPSTHLPSSAHHPPSHRVTATSGPLSSANPWRGHLPNCWCGGCCLPAPLVLSRDKVSPQLQVFPSRSWKGSINAQYWQQGSWSWPFPAPCLTLLLEKAPSHHDSPLQGRGLEALSVWFKQQVCRISPTLSTTRAVCRADAALWIPNCRGKEKKKKKNLWVSASVKLQHHMRTAHCLRENLNWKSSAALKWATPHRGTGAGCQSCIQHLWGGHSCTQGCWGKEAMPS